MALVALIRGLNVGGHRSFRPARLASALRHLGAVNIGATGALVVRRRVGRGALRAEIARRLPFDAEIVILTGREIARLASSGGPWGGPPAAGTVRFVSVLSRVPRSEPRLPLRIPAKGRWLVHVVERRGRFVLGTYRREMKVITHLGTLDRLYGVPVTTRGWNTIIAIAEVVTGEPTPRRQER